MELAMRSRLAEAIAPTLLAVLILASLFTPVAGQKLTPELAEVESVKFISMTLAVGICAVAAGYAVAKVSVAALASATERPELLGRAIIFVGLAEGIAIYGLLVAFLIWITA